MVANLVLWRHASGAIKRDFQVGYTSPNENFEYGFPHSNALLQFPLKLKRCKPHKATCHPRICDIVNNVKLFLTLYRRIYCRKFLTLSNQKPCYKSKCIRISYIRSSPVENKYDLELDFKVFFFTDSCCSDIVHDESN